MSRDPVRQLSVAVVRAVARDLGATAPLSILADERLGEPAIAAETAVAASYHAVVPLLWAAVERGGAPSGLRAAVHDAYLPLVARGLRLRHLLRVVDEALTSASVRYAVYKGPATARWYPKAEYRAFGDLDVLIERGDVGRADTALHDAGLHGSWAGVPDDYAEAGYHLPGFGVLDLHWHVMREAAVRASYALDTAAMLERAQRVDQADGTALTLDLVDELIAVATHACFDGAYRLGWFVDVAQLLRADALDRDEFAARCAQTRTALPVLLVLDRAARALDLPARPVLTGGMWRRAVDVLSAARPVEKTFRQAGRGGLVYRATRPTSAQSFAALGRLAYQEALRPLVGDPSHRWRTRRARRI